jgi:hypothetical protein
MRVLDVFLLGSNSLSGAKIHVSLRTSVDFRFQFGKAHEWAMATTGWEPFVDAKHQYVDILKWSSNCSRIASVSENIKFSSSCSTNLESLAV